GGDGGDDPQRAGQRGDARAGARLCRPALSPGGGGADTRADADRSDRGMGRLPRLIAYMTRLDVPPLRQNAALIASTHPRNEASSAMKHSIAPLLALAALTLAPQAHAEGLGIEADYG